ncbi:hypothetical protein PR048_007894 [Dryococelus australis]|uniref:Uncharacterized protein n=1 Tax=Dryococelus australis TaxID=614101 RepID=A0ABQ9HVJ1_9NEOP|nr:hypothetical protein PR048_007894 [Dryococelus australis]
MECDVDHSMIEKQKMKVKIPVYHPVDWFQLVRGTGRKTPFEVHEMKHEKFLDFAGLFRTGLWLQYRKDLGHVNYKYSHAVAPFKTMSFRRRGKVPFTQILQRYNSIVPISAEKKKDILHSLPQVPPIFHTFYLNLVTSDHVRDRDPDLLDKVHRTSEIQCAHFSDRFAANGSGIRWKVAYLVGDRLERRKENLLVHRVLGTRSWKCTGRNRLWDTEASSPGNGLETVWKAGGEVRMGDGIGGWKEKNFGPISGREENETLFSIELRVVAGVSLARGWKGLLFGEDAPVLATRSHGTGETTVVYVLISGIMLARLQEGNAARVGEVAASLLRGVRESALARARVCVRVCVRPQYSAASVPGTSGSLLLGECQAHLAIRAGSPKRCHRSRIWRVGRARKQDHVASGEKLTCEDKTPFRHHCNSTREDLASSRGGWEGERKKKSKRSEQGKGASKEILRIEMGPSAEARETEQPPSPLTNSGPGIFFPPSRSCSSTSTPAAPSPTGGGGGTQLPVPLTRRGAGELKLQGKSLPGEVARLQMACLNCSVLIPLLYHPSSLPTPSLNPLPHDPLREAFVGVQGPAVAERLACSPPTKANRVYYPARVTPGFSYVGIVPDDAAGRRVFSGISRFPRPFIPALLHTHP